MYSCLTISYTFIQPLYDICFLYITMQHTDVRDEQNMTPLHYACIGGHKDLVVYLIEVIKCDVGECVHHVV